jgi:pimeloyl-ACP methyl ester carboxylesterase
MTIKEVGRPHRWTRRSVIQAGLAGTAALALTRLSLAEETPVAPQFVTSKDGTPIAFDQVGSGPALVLVGGALSQRGAWAPIAKLLSAKFTVLSVDRRGRGDSGDTAPYAVEREIEDIAAVIDAAGGTAFVHGQSSGAVLSLRVAASYPDKVKKLSVYEPPLILDDSRPPVPADAMAQVSELVEANKRGDAVSYWMTDVVGAPPEAVAEMKAAPIWPELEAVANTLPYDLAVLGDLMSGRPLPANAWHEATMPVLVMSGGASPEWISASAVALANTLPKAEHKTLEGQTHDAAPDVLAPAVEWFLLG